MWRDDIETEITELFDALTPAWEDCYPHFERLRRRINARQGARRRERDLRLRLSRRRARVAAPEPACAPAGTCPKCGARLERREGVQRPIHFGRCVLWNQPE